MSKSILVTGATGVIGRWTPGFLRTFGYEVHVLGRNVTRPHASLSRWLQGCTCHDANLMDWERVQDCIRKIRPSHLMHLAWITDPGRVYSADENDVWTELSINLVRAFAREGGRRLVVAGTCAEYDWTHEFLDEESTPRRPSTRYGLAKASLREQIFQEAAALELSVAWPHVFYCFGPGEKPGRLVRDAVTALLAGEPFKCTTGLQERDYLYASDVARALAEVIDGSITGCLNVASGYGCRVRELVTLISRALGREDLVLFGARPQAPGEPGRIIGSTRRLFEEVGFRPAFSISDAILETIELHRDGEHNWSAHG
jgi:nucleoside-diphosphate-sugar epimerase